MMLQRDVRNGDVTQHVTPGIYPPSKFSSRREKEMGLRHNGLGEMAFVHNHNGPTTHGNYYMKNEGRNSSDVDDGVISNDGDYEHIRRNLNALEVEMETVAVSGYNNNKEKPPRLSHTESTDSGMGFSDNLKDGENSRLSAGDGYGTIHMIKPPQEHPQSRKSLIDGDAEYDEVMDFISTPTEGEIGERATTTSTFKTPMKPHDTEGNGGAESSSKYAELDLAKILHTRRRHKNTATLSRRQIEEEKHPDESMFNSLKRKPKSKNYSFSGYATYGRNRKSSKQQNSDSWASRPSSTLNEGELLTPLSDSHRIMPSPPFERQSKEVPLPQTHSNALNTRRNIFTNDLMMTSHVNDDVMFPSATLGRRTSWRTRPKSPPVEVDSSFADLTHGSKRWSWLSNSSSQGHSQASEKPSTPNKSPWKIFRRLLGGGDSKHKHHVTSTATSAASLSSGRSRSTSLFRRFSSRKSNKSTAIKRRNSVPANSEWDVHMTAEDGVDIAIHIPVMDAGKQRPVAPTALTQKTRGRLSTRLMSFRGSKNKRSKPSNDTLSKGLSISSPQLAINAIDPTRNYSQHQLLNLNNLSLNSGAR